MSARNRREPIAQAALLLVQALLTSPVLGQSAPEPLAQPAGQAPCDRIDPETAAPETAANPMAASQAASPDLSPLARLEAADALQRCRAELESTLQRSEALWTRTEALLASQFSSTTTLRADTRWWLGATRYDGNQVERGTNTYDGKSLRNGLSEVYDVRLTLNTSFDGRDLLKIRLRAGNGGFSDFRGTLAPSLSVNGVTPGPCEPGRPCRNNQLLLNRLYYQRPVGRHWHVTVGTQVTQKDMLGFWPSVYGDNESVLGVFDKAGAPGAYSDVKGAGVGLFWNQRAAADEAPALVLSGVYVAGRGERANPSQGGLVSNGSAGAGTVQVAYGGRGWGLAAVYTRNQAGALDRAAVTPLVEQTWPRHRAGLEGHGNAYGLSGFWQPLEAGWMPAINLGWGLNSNVYGSGGRQAGSRLAATSQSWMVGLNWVDAFDSGSELGFAVGMPQHMTAYTNPVGERGADDHAPMLELWYKFQATDQLSLTPAVFWLPRPRGQLTASGSNWAISPGGLPLQGDQGATLSVFGALLKLRLRF